MQIELLRRDAMKLLQAMFSITPKRFDAVDVLRASGKFIATMTDSEMLAVSDINESVIPTPAIAMDDRRGRDTTANNGLQRRLFAVRDDLCIDLAIALQDAEDDGLATRSATALTAHATRPEVRLVNFDFTGGERRRSLALLGKATADFEKDHGYALARQTRQVSDIGGSKIQRKEAQKLTEFLGGNSGTAVERVWSFHLSSLALH